MIETAERPFIHRTAVVEGDVRIGDRSWIGPYVVIGTPAEHRRAESAGAILIGYAVTIREHTVIQRGTGERETTIGHDSYIMHGCHVAHDCVLGPEVTLSPFVALGGHTRVHTGATLGIGAMTHQRTTIGAYAMVGMGAVVTRDVPPFAVVVGNPARFLRWNTAKMLAEGIDAGTVLGLARSGQFAIDSRRERIEVFP